MKVVFNHIAPLKFSNNVVDSKASILMLHLFIQESTLHLVLRLRGGAKKRKKKSYTTPKKNKHKRKKVKLAVLKYYKVGYLSGMYSAFGFRSCQYDL